MEMRNYLEIAEKKAGKQIELAKMLEVSSSFIRMVKAGKKGLSDDMCIVLADFIDEDRLKVIAASNLVTVKDEKKRKIFESCFTTQQKTTVRDNATKLIISGLLVTALAFSPLETVEAKNVISQDSMYIMLN
jgi:plasmid maintenance system antidote protein VapI